ncbi:hypothetical protein [Flectobacillus longus]|uniref:hypothetical protein n=1 Tax=Flectobacillus longus TaxID=2984207 RepID=UPI0024B83410|nr:hypothetical protein [Flectobacillus longus]MDI9882810.1 hypothetical protein [Flectobacillus longus]
MSWWTTRGKYKEYGRNIIFRMLEKLQKQVGKGILHVLDRGYANEWTIEWRPPLRFTNFEQDFLVRWKNTYPLN